MGSAAAQGGGDLVGVVGSCCLVVDRIAMGVNLVVTDC